MLATPLALPRDGLRVLLDLVLPARCPGCGTIVPGDMKYCATCWDGLRFITAPLCACCGTPFEFDLGPQARCGACLATPPKYTRARAAVVYADTGRTVLLSFKNRDREHLARVMAAAMLRAGAELLEGDPLLVPVPLHRWRLLRRGFNQSALLAGRIGKARGLDVAVDALVRVRATPRSRGMSRSRRAANVRGVFKVARPDAVRGRTVVLIDDVMTTGATAEACTRLLLRKGARCVHILTWARVVRDAGRVT